jgi:hypothetical protein
LDCIVLKTLSLLRQAQTVKTGIELHSRGRPIITCESWDERAPQGSEPITKQGYIIKRTRDAIWVTVERSNPSTKVFSTIPQDGTYGYERRSLSSGRGWRIDLSKIKLEEIPINDQAGTS